MLKHDRQYGTLKRDMKKKRLKQRQDEIMPDVHALHKLDTKHEMES